MSSREAYEATRIAHTARCKLHMEADRPDRNLRFILGHAFTLDKMMLRIAEIEVDSSSSSDEDDIVDDGRPTCSEAGLNGRKVSFSGRSGAQGRNAAGGVVASRNRSPPPPPQLESDSSEDEEEEEDDIEPDDEEDDGLGLTRFPSAAGHVRATGGAEDVKEPAFLTEEELREVCSGEGNEELRRIYGHVAGCPCHGERGPEAEKFWEVPGQQVGGPRRVVVQVAA